MVSSCLQAAFIACMMWRLRLLVSRLSVFQLPFPCIIVSATKLAQAFCDEVVLPSLTFKAFG